MDANDNTINALETDCFPRGCQLPGMLQYALATTFVPQLKAAGMTAAEWTRGAELLEEPYLSQTKGIVCAGCAIFTCEHNSRQGQQPENFFRQLRSCGYAARRDMNEKLLELLLPTDTLTKWEACGITISFKGAHSSCTQFGARIELKHPTRNEICIILRHDKKVREILLLVESNRESFPLPATPEATARALQEIVDSIR